LNVFFTTELAWDTVCTAMDIMMGEQTEEEDHTYT
jgi:hypothetical protein